MSATTAVVSRHGDQAILARPSTSLWQDAWRRLLRNKMAVVGMVVVVLFIFVAAFAPAGTARAACRRRGRRHG